MCEFCESIVDESKKVIWNVRSTFADDNICEFVNDMNCSSCKGCKMGFTLSSYKWDDDIHVSVNYRQVVTTPNREDVIISPFSETMQWNFCPVCGSQISKNIKKWDRYGYYSIDIRDRSE